MKEEVINLLRCPCCTGKLRVLQVLEQNEDDIVHGRLMCNCNEYPILQGILILEDNSYSIHWTRRISDCIKKEDLPGIKTLLNVSLSSNPVGISWLLGLLLPSRIRKLNFLNQAVIWMADAKLKTGSAVQFNKLLKDSGSYVDILDDPYYFYRFSSDSFLPSWLTIPLLGKMPHIVIDAGCGGGHASFLISNLVKPRVHFCLDYNFRHLLLTKKFCAPDAQCIVYDMNYPLPFEDKSVNGIFTSDALHYVHQRRLITSEIQRIMDDDSVLILSHLHNALGNNPSAGQPLSSQSWIAMFDQIKTRAIPESRLIEDFLAKRPLDLSIQYSPQSLDEANAISIIAARSNDKLSEISPLTTDRWSIKGKLIINPIYKVKSLKDKTVLEMHIPSPKYQKEFPWTFKTLPKSCILEFPREEIDGIDVSIASSMSEKNRLKLEALMDKLLLLIVPDNFVSNK